MIELKASRIKKILIIRLRFIGDVIISTPVIEALKKAYPDVEISYLAEEMPLEMLKNNPNIKELLINKKSKWTDLFETVCMIRRRKYDAVIDVFGNPRSALITLLSGARYRIGWEIRGRGICYNRHIVRKDIIDPEDRSDCIEAYEDVLRLFGIAVSDKKTEIFLDTEEQLFARNYAISLGLNFEKPVIGLQPGSRRGPTMTWPKEKYAELAGKLIEAGYQVMLFGGPKDKPLVKDIYERLDHKAFIVEGLQIRQDIALMKLCNCFITNNHGPLHMAIAVETPTIGIFRPDETFTWFPYKDKRYRVIDKAGICKYCVPDACLDPKCMAEITVQRVFNTAVELIEQKKEKN